MIYFKRIGDKVSYHANLEAAKKDWNGAKPDVQMHPAEFLAHNSLVRIINNKIFFGKTEAEKAAEEKQKMIDGFLGLLGQIDHDAGAGRHMRDIAVSAGVVLDAVRILLSKLAKELDINLPDGFGAGIEKAEDILSLMPDPNASKAEQEDFAVYKALLLVSHFDPAINPGLTKIREAEMKAMPIRAQLAPLLEGE